MGEPKTTRAQRGVEETRQMEAIMAAHESALLGYAASILRSPQAAQDVVQNVFIKLFRMWKPGMQPTDSLRGWLYRCTHNEAVDHIRHESRLHILHLRRTTEADPPAAPAGSPGNDEAEKQATVLAHVQELDPAEQQVILLRLQEGLSYKEISRATGRSEGNVGCLLHHAVKKLSRLVQKAGEAEP